MEYCVFPAEQPGSGPGGSRGRARVEDGAHERNRTFDLLLTKEVLYRLSYVSELWCVPPGFNAEADNGAGDGNRTRTSSLEGYSSTIELLPHRETTTTRNNNGKLVEGGGFEPPKA